MIHFLFTSDSYFIHVFVSPYKIPSLPMQKCHRVSTTNLGQSNSKTSEGKYRYSLQLLHSKAISQGSGNGVEITDGQKQNVRIILQMSKFISDLGLRKPKPSFIAAKEDEFYWMRASQLSAFKYSLVWLVIFIQDMIINMFMCPRRH